MSAILEFDISLCKVMNFSLQQNGIHTVRSAVLRNTSDRDIRDVVVRIESVPKELCLPNEQHLDGLPSGTEMRLDNFQPIFNTEYLVQLPEKMVAALQFSVCKDDEVLGSTVCEFEVLPADQWHGSGSYRELLAAFCLPNHELIPNINRRAAELLEQRTGDPSLTAYFADQNGQNRSLQIAGAIYDAIVELEIAYAVSPASFTETGQRVRLVEEVLRKRLANCLEMTLLYCACLEAAGLNPLFLVQSSHIFSGVWLEDKTFPDAVFTDPSLIIKRLDEGVREIALVESTMMCAGSYNPFDAAQQAAKKKIVEEGIVYAVDVTTARRRARISPMPLCTNEDEDHTFSIREPSGSRHFTAPDELTDAVPDAPAAITYTRRQQWERHLLNLDLRNPLLDLRFGRNTTIPLCCSNMQDMVTALGSEEEFAIHSLESAANLTDYEALGNYSEDDSSDFSQNRFRTPLTPTELLKRGKKLRALAKTAIEEKGGNTLFAGVGMLRWFEETGAPARYAPILLYPLDIITTPSGCKIRLREDEVQVNATMIEKMKQDFRISFPSWDTTPTREDGTVDVAKVMATIRHCVREQPHWNVVKGAYISNFNFSQFVLWRDLKQHPEVLDGNLLVSSLQDGRLKWVPDDAKFLAKMPGDLLILPIAVDGSQLFAIENAVNGETFLLHGPPGTGKSQTITAAIAAALQAGKKVIFVTEKLAGLSVVQKRLEDIGLAPFCLELHSDKARKQDVLRHLDKVLELAANHTPTGKSTESEDLKELKKTLDAYAEVLHRKGDSGMSLYQLVTLYQQIGDGVEFDPEFFPDPKDLTPEMMLQRENLLDRIVLMRKALGNPATHALRHIHTTTYSQQFKQKLGSALSEYTAALETLGSCAEKFTQAQDLESTDGDYTQLETLYEITRHLQTWSEIPVSLATASPTAETLSAIKELAAMCIRVNSLRSELLEQWHKEFLSMSGKTLLEEFRNGKDGPAIRRPLVFMKLNRQLLPLQKEGIPTDQLGEHLEKLVRYQSLRKQVNQTKQLHQDTLTQYFGNPPYHWPEIATLLDDACRAASCLRGLTHTEEEEFITKYAPGREYPEAAELRNAWESAMEKRKVLYALLGIESPQRSENWLGREQEYCDLLTNQTDMLKEWIGWNALCQEATEKGMGFVVKACCSDTEPEQVSNGYRKTLYRRIIGDVIDREPVFSEFTGLVFNQQIEQLRRLDRELQTKARQDIYDTILNRISQVLSTAKVEGAQLSTLKKAISSGGRGTTVRKLFCELTDLLLELCPCMLMSPLSVAQYLPMQNDLVDTVIFDEASQIPTSKAVGTLARGKSAMIVGDVNQMPPTSFFNSVVLDEDNLDTEDLESILDDCLAIDVPGTSLNWHYRSRHESLIAFSNSYFYENKLLTFPSAQDRNSHVHLRLVENGVFGRGKSRRNPAEAQAIIDELCRMSTDDTYSDKSVGIITFNIEQQDLVEELLQDACRSNVALSSWCARASEPLFVKNLENVQGDERDVILLSVGYGPDENGKVSMNFGPLNKEGGWRRLNVAVSRARYEMQVFTSMTPEQIDLNRSSAKGVHALRAFLEYAGGAPLQVKRTQKQVQDDVGGIRDRLCRLLKEAGYRTESNVGYSDLRVDVAVIHPEHPDQYILGILLDGASYAGARTTRDRELAHVDVLKGLGWQIHRIWTIDWWDNPRKEARTLLQKLESLH